MRANPNECNKICTNFKQEYTNNDIVRKCANISSITEIIKHLAKSWASKIVVYSLDIKKIIKTAVAFPNTPLACIKN